MRLNRLYLSAFGPFTNETLEFRSSPCDLHVVYGPNEAGKSTTLRAVKGLFFGIPRDTSDAYLHASAKLAIGAELAAEVGTRTLFRRKKRSGSLTDENGNEVREEELLRFLGGMDEATFARRLGLDQTELERGADALLSGSEEGLFAAGTGGADVRILLSELEKRGEELWKRNGKNPLLNQAIAAYSASRKFLSEQIRPSEFYESQRKDLEAITETLLAATSRRRALRLEEKESSKLLSMLGDLASIRAEQDAIQSLGEVVQLPQGARAEREETETQLREVLVLLSELTRRESALVETLASLPAYVPLEDAEAELGGLEKRLGSERKAMDDVGKLRARLVGIEEELVAKARELGLPLSGSSVVDAAQERLPHRIAEAAVRSLDAESSRLVESVRGVRDQVSELRSELETNPPAADETESRILRLERALRDRASLRESIALARQAFQASKLAKERLESQLQMLPKLDLELLELLPEQEALRGALAELAELSVEVRTLSKSRFELSEKLQEVRLALESERQGVPEFRESELASMRQHRDAKFEEFVVTPKDRALADGVRSSIRDADLASDSLRIHAARIAKVDSFRREETRLSALLGSASERFAELEEARRGVSTRILAPFRKAGFLVDDAVQLPRIAEVASDLRNARAQAKEAESAFDALSRELVAAETTLRRVAEELVPSLREAKLSGLLDGLERELAGLRQIKETERVQFERRELDRAKLRALELKERTLLKQLEATNAELSRRLAQLNLSVDLRSEELDAVLRGLAELQTKVDAGRDLRRRIEGIERDTRELEQHLLTLASRYGHSLSGTSLLEKGEKFLADATLATGVAEQRRRAEIDLSATRRRLDELAASKSQHEYRLDLLAKAANVATPAELALAESRSEQFQLRSARLSELRKKVLSASGGEAIEDLLDRARSVTAQFLSVRLDELGVECDALDGEIRDLETRKSAVEAGLERFRTVDVAELRQTVSSRGAEARLLLQLAMKNELKRILLSEQMTEFARRFNGPLAERASELFSSITLGHYEGLEFGLVERTLRCRRGTERVEVANLSRGTCAQLYLSLRLASLELYFSKNAPIPVVFDDLFVDFDDDRATAAFEAIAALAKKTQVLYFTHLSRDLELLSVVTEKPNIHRLGVR